MIIISKRLSVTEHVSLATFFTFWCPYVIIEVLATFNRLKTLQLLNIKEPCHNWAASHFPFIFLGKGKRTILPKQGLVMPDLLPIKWNTNIQAQLTKGFCLKSHNLNVEVLIQNYCVRKFKKHKWISKHARFQCRCKNSCIDVYSIYYCTNTDDAWFEQILKLVLSTA